MNRKYNRSIWSLAKSKYYGHIYSKLAFAFRLDFQCFLFQYFNVAWFNALFMCCRNHGYKRPVTINLSKNCYNSLCYISYSEDCGVVLAPLNGKINDNQGTNYNAEMQFSCHTGYLLVGAKIIKCEDTGKWNNAPPICVAKCK